MVSEPQVTYVQCPSCLRRNNSEMQFCIYCGTGVTPEAEKKRTQNPLSWRTCNRCGQTDELNQNFCIFCSGKIVVPGGSAPESTAYKRFTNELDLIDTNKVASQVQVAAVKTAASRGTKPQAVRAAAGKGSKAGIIALFACLGIASGAGLSIAVGQASMQKLVLQQTSWHPGSLIVYTDTKFAEVLIEDAKQNYILTQTASDGTFFTDTLAAGDPPDGHVYNIKIGSPGGKTLMQTVHLLKRNAAVSGFPTKWPLMKSDKK